MREKFSKYKGWHGWILRAGYLVALAVFAGACLGFYADQSAQNRKTDSIREISDSFAGLDMALLDYSNKAKRIAETYYETRAESPLANALGGMSLKQRKVFLADAPSDPDIISAKTGLEFYRSKANEAFDVFLRAWSGSGEELSAALFKNARFMPMDDPFKHYIDILNSETVKDARFKKDIYWSARQISENFESLIVPNNLHVQQQLRRLLQERAVEQGDLLEQFLLFSIGVVAVLAVFIFIPVDIFLQRLLGKLEREHSRAEEAMQYARNADRAKSEFLANMSHEIRTPMNGVMGMAELLAKTDLNAKQKTFTDIIVKSGASLLTIINDILDFSKIDAGQMELDPAPYGLSDAINDVATLVSSRVAEKDLELIVRVDPKLPDRIVGDVGRIRQIITNLLGNAVKFTDAGHVYVNVFEVADDENGSADENATRMLRFEIQDTGVGIPQDKVTRIFEKFSQVDGSATRKHEGTGLGLSIAASLVTLMQGKIGVDSVEGEGSTFWFEIPLVDSGESNRKKRIPKDVTGACILVVDDNEVNRSILSEQLASWRFDSAAAVSGDEALRLLEAAHQQNINIDCVILDYHMPAMNGGEVVQKMRANTNMVETPVIMLTSVDQTEDGKAFSSLGIQAHLTKPARSSLLLETIIDVLEEERARSDSSNDAAIGIKIARQVALGEPGEGEIQEAADAETPVISDQENDTVSNAPAQEPKVSVDATSDPVELNESYELEILVCEDNEVNQIVFTQILQSLGCNFHLAKNGREGVAAYKAKSPKLILMDVSMPLMNGIDATRAIRELEAESGHHTPIIAVTAHAIKGDMERCLEAGMDDYLSKPVSPERLEAKIKTWMKKSSVVKVA